MSTTTATTATSKTTNRILGGLLITTALGLGALTGHLTNHTAPAHAETPPADICGISCIHNATGSGGNVPATATHPTRLAPSTGGSGGTIGHTH